MEADPGLSLTLRTPEVRKPGGRGYSALQVVVRAKVTVEPGWRLAVLAAAGEHTCELEVLIVRHRASGWVREIARKSEDQVTEAEFDRRLGSPPFTRAAASSASSNAPPARRATARSASRSMSRTGCLK